MESKSKRKMNLKRFFKQNVVTIIGVLVGTVGGYLYESHIGCSNGTCPIFSSPVFSSLWGAVFGGLLFNMFQRKEKK